MPFDIPFLYKKVFDRVIYKYQCAELTLVPGTLWEYVYFFVTLIRSWFISLSAEVFVYSFHLRQMEKLLWFLGEYGKEENNSFSLLISFVGCEKIEYFTITQKWLGGSHNNIKWFSLHMAYVWHGVLYNFQSIFRSTSFLHLCTYSQFLDFFCSLRSYATYVCFWDIPMQSAMQSQRKIASPQEQHNKFYVH